MKPALIGLVLALMIGIVLAPAGAVQDAGSAAAAQVTVSSVSIDPAVFFEGDTGVITIEVVNTGAQSVAIRRATMYDTDISVVSSSYDLTTTLGAGNRMTFSFTVRANVPPGLYYPSFSLDFRDAGYLRYPVQLRVENNPLEVSILDKPEVYGAGRKDRIDIMVGNPRTNPVSGVIIHFRGEALDPTPSSYFIGTLDPGQAQKLSFNVTPGKETTLDIVAEYKNGINAHSAVVSLPVRFGESKRQAELILSNIVIVYKDGSYSLSGDVTNVGLEVANSVVLSAGAGTEPVNPYREYVVGSLQPDDFSSFEITFLADDSSPIEVVVRYRDMDGNPFSRSTTVAMPQKSTGRGEGEGSGIAAPIIGVILLSVAIIAGAIWYSWKKR